MAYVNKNPVGSRIASFLARQAKKAAEEAAIYAKLAESSVKTVGMADLAPKELGALISTPDLSAAGQAEMALASRALAADPAKVASAYGMPTNDQAGMELAYGTPAVLIGQR